MEAQQVRSVVQRALVSFTGTTTSAGNAGGSTLVCSALTSQADFDRQQVIITSGAFTGKAADIQGATTGGTVTVTPAYGAQIGAGVNFVIMTGLPSTAEIGDPSGHTLTTLTDKWGDIARSLDVILGARWDASGDLGTDIASLLGTNVGKKQVKEVSVTSAANAGDVTLATITTQPCVIESIVIHADTVQTGDLTSAGIFGGAAKVVTFIAAADALQADLDAIDKQVFWEGAVRLAAAKTIVIALAGTGATPVDLTVTITYRAAVDGGYLA